MNNVVIPCLCAGLLLTAAYAAEEQTARTEEQPATTASSAEPEFDAGETIPAFEPASVKEPVQAQTAQPLAEADLELLHGGATTVTNNQTLTATSSHNVLNGDYVAGSVILSDEALSNFDGFGNFAINTGGQVNIQSAMSVTINVGD